MSVEKQRRIRLASASPRRHELVNLTGWGLIVSPAEVDEVLRRNEDPAQFAQRLALDKAEVESRNVTNSDIILAADTIVVDGNQILGKPSDAADAKRILLKLRGKSHHVLTALALIDQEQKLHLVDICETKVPMRMFSDKELEAYIISGDPMDKAGAYGIQNAEFHPVAIEKLIGCYTNVMGLPLCHLSRSMQRLGMQPVEDIPSRCKSATNFDCQVFEDILRN